MLIKQFGGIRNIQDADIDEDLAELRQQLPRLFWQECR